MSEFIVDEKKCTKCGTCVSICPAGIIRFGDFGFPEMDERLKGRCIECGQCVLFCPACADELSFMKDDSLIKCADMKLPTQEEGENLIRSCRSIRKYKDTPITHEEFEKIFYTVRQAPSAVNAQPVRWIVTEDAQKTKEVANLILCWLREEIFKDPTSPVAIFGAAMIRRAREGDDVLLRGAPHIAVAVVPKEYRWPEDGSIALTYFDLAAHNMGIGCCRAGYLTMAVRSFKGLREFLGISEEEHVCGALMAGWPKLKPVREFPMRREADVHWM